MIHATMVLAVKQQIQNSSAMQAGIQPTWHIQDQSKEGAWPDMPLHACQDTVAITDCEHLECHGGVLPRPGWV